MTETPASHDPPTRKGGQGWDKLALVAMVLGEAPGDYIHRRRQTETSRDHTGAPIGYRDIAADITAALQRAAKESGVTVEPVSHEAVRRWHQSAHPEPDPRVVKGRRGEPVEPAPAVTVEREAERTARIRELTRKAKADGGIPQAVFQAPPGDAA